MASYQMDEADYASSGAGGQKTKGNGHIPINLQPSNAKLIETVLSNPEDYYKMSAEPRGRVIILNNENFEQSDDEEDNLPGRHGSYFDVENMRNLFDALHFETVVWSNVTSSQIRQKIKEERKSDFHKNADAFIFVIMSHGTDEHIHGTNGRKVHIKKEIIDFFDGNNCPQLIGKPKLFFIQACQGEKATTGAVSDSAHPQLDPKKAANILHEKADIVLFHSTVPGYISWRNTGLGSWFIRELVLCINQYSHEWHFEDIVTKINNKLSEKRMTSKGFKQISKSESTLRKKLHFLH